MEKNIKAGLVVQLSVIFCIIPTHIIWKSDRLTYGSSEVEERSSYNRITKKFWLSDGRFWFNHNASDLIHVYHDGRYA